MVVDDHQVVRDGIKLLLADTPDLVASIMAGAAGYVRNQIRGQDLVRPSARSGPATACWTRP